MKYDMSKEEDTRPLALHALTPGYERTLEREAARSRQSLIRNELRPVPAQPDVFATSPTTRYLYIEHVYHSYTEERRGAQNTK